MVDPGLGRVLGGCKAWEVVGSLFCFFLKPFWEGSPDVQKGGRCGLPQGFGVHHSKGDLNSPAACRASRAACGTGSSVASRRALGSGAASASSPYSTDGPRLTQFKGFGFRVKGFGFREGRGL